MPRAKKPSVKTRYATREEAKEAERARKRAYKARNPAKIAKSRKVGKANVYASKAKAADLDEMGFLPPEAVDAVIKGEEAGWEPSRRSPTAADMTSGEFVRGEFMKPLDRVGRELASRELARRQLLEYVLRTENAYEPGWVHHDICARLTRFSKAVSAKQSPRLMIQMPPRGGKSTLATKNFPSWHLGREPGHEIIAASYSEDLPLDFSKQIREQLLSPDYLALFPGTKLHAQFTNATGWRTAPMGGFKPVGVGGGLTGFGAHILVIDDPVRNAEEAESATALKKCRDWYTSTAYTRLAPGGGVLVIQTRWADGDLSGWLEDQMHKGEGDDWEIVRYPALATEDEQFRKVGESFHPGRWPEETLHQIKKTLPPRQWAALYQQNPVPEDGAYFSEKDLRFYTPDQVPELLDVYAAWDLAIGKRETNDFTAGLTFGIDEHDDIWILDLIHGRFDSFEIVEKLLDSWVRYKHRQVGIEHGQLKMAIGPYLNKRIRERRLFACPITELKPGRSDKQARARTIQGRTQQGKVLLPQRNTAPWVEQLITEMLRFPYGVNDDCVDVMAYAGLMAQNVSAPRPETEAPKPSWRDKLPSLLGGLGGGGRTHMSA